MSLLKHLSCHLMLTLVLSIGADSVNEYYTARWSRCFYSSPDLSDMMFTDNFYFNKHLIIHFNSTWGRFVGFNEYGVKIAEIWNNGPGLQNEIASIDDQCRFYIKSRDPAIRDKAVKPKVKLSLVKQAGGSHPNPTVLMCSAYEFYPPHIKVSWLRNGDVITSDSTSVMELADGDWYYQIHSELVYIPKSGEKISCMVEHGSFNKPMIYVWDPSLSESERIKIGIGVSGLILGFIIASAGLIYYCMKKSAETTIPCQ